MRNANSYNRTRGTALIYSVMVLFVLLGMGALSLDLARIHAAKGELKGALDAAVRAGLSGLQKGETVVRSRAIEYAGQNTVAGSRLVISDSNVTIGRWNTGTRAFTPRNGAAYSQMDAVRVEAEVTVPLLFHRIFPSVSISASSIAAAVDNIPPTVPGTCNPWLAGMPDGTPGNTHDVAGSENQSPVQVLGVTLVAGEYLTFGPVTGSVLNYRDMNELKKWKPDGGDVYDHVGDAENGMSDLKAPINSLIGVFLTDARPDRSPAPEALDYTSANSRNKSTYEPKLKQPFFIGDGLRTNGDLQKFKVPQGATRLFLGTMDGYEWSNNVGSLTLGQPLGKGGIVLVK